MLTEVQKSNRDGLTALRDLLARTLEDAEPKDVASLAGRLQSVLAALDSLPAAKGINPLDEIAAKRTKRRAPASAGGATPDGKRRAGSG